MSLTPTQVRKYSKWKRTIVEWQEDNTIYLSVVFSWHLNKARERATLLTKKGFYVRAGGPAVLYNPSCISDVADISGSTNALPYHNPDATFTTRGCIRKCKFCTVPVIEGDLVELPDDMWEPKPIICDNNLLAASIKHFDHVIDRLLESDVAGIDFNQGLDARILTPFHAARLVELHKAKKLTRVRFAWDHTRDEGRFRQAMNTLREAGMPKSKIGVYVLMGFGDTPSDALYRLSTIADEMKLRPNPMCYQPVDAMKKNEYVDEAWTDDELKKYMRYWANLRYTRGIPFEEFDNKYRSGRK